MTKEELDVIYKQRCKQLYNYGLCNDEMNQYSNFQDAMSEVEFEDVIKRKNNRRNKRYRTREKYKELYQISYNFKNANIVFGTITLNDYYLGLEESTYIRYINNWLKKHFLYVILNKDFGKETEREHYHFIGLTTERIEKKGKKSRKGYEMFELIEKDYKLGFEPTLLKIDLKKNDLNKTTNYLLKLNNHSNKVTTRDRIRVLKSPILKILTKVKE